MNLRHHAFVIEAEAEEGIEVAQAWAEKELPSFAQGYGGHGGMKTNPDMVVLRYGLFSVETFLVFNQCTYSFSFLKVIPP